MAKRIESTTVAAGWVELAQTLSIDGAAGTLQWPATTAFFRVMYRSSGTPTDIALLYAEDVEAKLAADASAVAASGSASSAATKADLAGQKAEAASGSAATAGTKAGEALASEGKAAKSASDASGSASSASTSSNVAATAKTAAETAAKRTFPTTFEDNLVYFSSPLPRTVIDGAYVFSNASVGTFANILRRGVSSNAPGKKWKVRMRAKADRAGANTLMRVMAFTDDGQSTNPPTPYYTEAVVAVTTSWAWYEVILDAPTNGSLVAPIVYPSYPALNAIVSVSALEMFDATSEQAALASATASATSASTAAASKKDAGDQASAASTSATNAKTSAGEAKTSASNASTSESEAGKSAATASTQAGVSARAASDGAATIANADRSPGAALSLWSYNDYNTFRPTTRLTTESVAITSVAGTLRVSSAGAFHIHPVAPIRMQPGKRYRAFVRFRMTEDGPQSSHHYLFASFFDANGTILTGNVVTLTAMGPTTVAAGWQELSRDFSSDGSGGTYGAPAGTAFMRVMYRTSGTAEEIALLYIEDVEGQLASAGSASAASASASTATASKDLAGQSASAAEGSKTKAETAAGAAEISRAAAAISESNAAGSSNSAATSQKLAASAGATRGLSTNGMFAAGDVGFTRSGVYYGNLYQGVGYRSNTGVAGTVTSEQFIPVDISRTYRLTTAYVVHGVAQTIYVGVGCFDAQKAFLGNIYMPQILPIIRPGGTIVPTVSNEYSGSYPEATPMFRHGSSFPAATKFVQPLAFLNYDSVAGGISDINALYLEDITSEKNARDKAQASNDSSASAAASAKGAEQSASASEISRQAAVTAKGGAEAARDAAVISASNAEGSSNTATSSAALAATANRGATTTVASTLPSDFSQGSLFWSANYSGPDTRDKAIPAHYNFETDTGVLRATGGGFNDIAHLASIPLVKGKRHRLTAVWNVINAAGAPSANCTLYFIGLNVNMAGNFTPGANYVIPGSGPGWGDNNGFQVSVFDYNDDDMLANGSIRVRGLFRYNNDSQNQQWRLKSFVLEDITSEAKSQDFASASNISAGAASASAGKAGDYASAANQSKLDAQAASDKSLGQAGIATTAAATATSQAALATTSATLSAAVSSGLANRGATFSDWPDAAAIPTYWSGWGNSANNRKIGIVGRYGFQQYAANGAAETGLYSDARFDNGFTALKSGTYVVDAEVTLDGGSFYGSGVLFRAFDANGGIVQDTPLNFGSMKSDISPDAATGDGMAGSRYRFTELVTLPASTASVGMYAMTQWAGFGARAEKLLTWHKVGPRRATQQEIQSGKVAGLDARVTTQAGAISTLSGKNMAWLQQDVSAGNGRAIVSLKADGVTNSSQIDLAASQIRFMNSSGGILAPTFTVAGGNVSIAGDLFMGSGRIVSTNGSYMKVQGTGFGTTNQFIEWFGPNMAISACSEANAKSYLRTDGQAYFGGALLAGTLRTSNTNPSVQASVTATSGPISSNGGVVVINVSWSYNTSQVAYYAGTQAGLQNFRNVAASYGGVNNGSGSWSGSQVRDNGTSTLTLSKDGNPVQAQTTNSVVFSVFGTEPNQGAGEDGQLTITSSASIVFTYSDSTRNTNNREYTATLARSSGITPGGGTVRQGVSINTVE
ncbi:hypothetical protein [Sphingomonas sp. NFX23]|uniref:hypothetical protein n=1 Tax=Sphingomonas sp. NFX23 TaxID=2819532 RepID=UPI003CEA20E8